MRPYISLLRARALTLFSYRAAAIAGLITQWVFGFIMISVLMAFYEGADAAQPMALAETVTYTWIGQAILGIVPWNIDQEVGESVRTGAIAYDLARPISLFGHWYARAIAQRTAPTLLRCVPMFLITSLLLPAPYAIAWPAPAVLAAFLLLLLGAVLLSSAITVFMHSTLFWTTTGDGIIRIVPGLAIILGGLSIPLPLFPDWMQRALALQPFAGILSMPALSFCGIMPPGGVLAGVCLQLFWTLCFVCLGRLLLARGMRRLTVAGG